MIIHTKVSLRTSSPLDFFMHFVFFLNDEHNCFPHQKVKENIS